MSRYQIGNDLYDVVNDGQFDEELNDGTKLRKVKAVSQPFDQEKSVALASAYGIFSKVNPDQEARDRETAKMLNVPVWTVQAAPQTRTAAEEIAKQKMNSPEDWNRFTQDHPKTAQWLSEQNNLAIAHDDITNLSKTEQVLRNISEQYPLKTYGNISEGAKDVGRSSLGFFQGVFENLARGSQANREQMAPEYKMWSELGGSQKLTETASFFDMVLQTPALKEQKSAAPNSWAERYYQDVIRMGPQIGSQILIGGLGGPIAGVGFMGTQIAGSDYLKLRSEGVSPERALAAGIGDAAVQAPLEQLSLGKFMNMFKSTSREGKLLKEIGGVLGTEFLTEWVQKYPEAASEIWAKTEGKDFETRAKMFVDDFAKITAEGIYEGLVTVPYSLLGGTGKVLYEAKSAHQGQQSREKLTALNETTKESKVRMRDPEVYASNVDNQVKGTQFENVIIPAQALMEYFQDAAPGVIQNLGIDDFQEKLAAGADVSIPLGKYMATIGGTEHFDKLLPNARFNPEEKTDTEVKQFMQSVNDTIKQAAEEKAQASLSKEERENVQANIRDQLLASGRTKQEAEYGSKLVAMFSDRMTALGAPKENLRSLGNVIIQPGKDKSQGAVTAPQFMQAIATQESSGDPTAYNPDGEAYGKYQFQPATWDTAARIAGMDNLVGVKPNEVSEADQDAVASAYAQHLYKKYGDWRKVALSWYAGEGAVNWSEETLNKKQGDYPSINEYVDQVMARIPNQGAVQSFTQFAGLQADTADYLALETAKSLLQQGQNIETIREQTGWFQGMDNKWRFEIDDSQAKLVDVKGIETEIKGQITGILSQAKKVKSTTEKEQLESQADVLISELSQKKAPLLGNVLDHPTLYQAYPWIKNIKVLFDKMKDGDKGGYEPAINTITINSSLSQEEQKGTLLHEVQHVIQEQENFARGGSPDTVNPEPGETAYQTYQRLGGEIEARDTANRANLSKEDLVIVKPSIRGDAIITYGGLEYAYKSTSEENRGSIQFFEDKTVINIFEKANKSTIFHELGHLFLTDYMTVAGMDNAPEQVKRDWKALKQWLSIKGEYADLSEVEQKRVQEQFARGFETYLREGKAPSTKLLTAFRAFRKWLTKVYASITELNVTVSPEVKAIMDRMLASEEEIREAEIIAEMKALDKDILDKLSPEEREQYLTLKQGAHETAVEILLAKRMEELNEQNDKFADMYRAAAENEAKNTLQGQPVYQALEVMSQSDMKINRQSILDAYGEKTLASLPLVIYADTASLTADDAADLFGFGSGDEMLQAISSAKPYNEAVADFVSAKMAERVTAMKPEQVKEEARNALFNDDMLKLLSLERSLMENKLTGTDARVSKILTLADTDLRALLENKRDTALDEQVKYLIANSKLGVEKRVTTSDGDGGYVFSAGYSRNHPWYSDILELSPDGKLPSNWGKYISEFKANSDTTKQMPIKMREVYEEVAKEHLQKGFQAIEGEVPPNDNFRAVIDLIAELDQNKDKAREKLLTGSALRSISETELREYIEDRKAEKYQRMREALDRYRSIVRMARKTVEGRPYREAINFRSYLASARKSAQKTETAIRAGDMEAAQRNKETHMIAHAMSMESIRVKSETDKMFKYLERYAKKSGKKPNIDESYLNQIDKVLYRFGFKEISRSASMDETTLANWIEAHKEAGDAAIPPMVANEGYSKHYKDLTIEELRDIMSAIRNIETAGRNEKKFITDEMKRDFDEVLAEVETNIYETHGINHPPNYDPNQTTLEKAINGIQGYRASHKKVEFIVRALDGYKDQGPAWKYIIRPLVRALDKEVVLRREGFTRYEEIVKRHYGPEAHKKLVQTKYHISEVSDIWPKGITKENIIAIALNWGNADNRNRVLDSYTNPETETEMTVQKVDTILSKMTKEDWLFVQDVWNFLDEYWPMTVQVAKERTGVAPRKIDPTPFTITLESGDKVELQGGYYPISYDPTKSEAAYSQSEFEDFKSIFNGSFIAPGVRNGFTQARAQRVIGRPLNLQLSVIDKHLTDVIHLIAFSNPIRDVNKLISNKRMERAIKQSLGGEMYKQFKPWLLHIGYEYRLPMSNFEKILSHARMGATIVNMGLKFSTAFSQLAGIFPIMKEVGSTRALGAMLDFHSNPFTWKEKAQLVFDKSPMMQARMSNFDRDVRDMSKKLIQSGKMTKVQQSWFYLTGLFDYAISLPGWQAAYEKSIEDQMKTSGSFNEETAQRYADGIIRMTQGSGDAINLSAIQRGSESQKLFTMFYSYFNVYANGLEEQIDRTKSVKDIPRLFSWFVYWTFLPAVLSEFLAGRGPGDDDDWASWTLQTALRYPFAAYVGIRDIVSAMGSKFDYETTPAAAGVKKLVDLWKSTGGKIADDKDVDWDRVSKLAIETGGYWFLYPSRQLIITGENMIDYMAGNDSEFYIRDLFFAKPKERR